MPKKFLLIIDHNIMKVWHQRLDIKKAMEARLILETYYYNYKSAFPDHRVLVSDSIKYRNYELATLDKDYVLRVLKDFMNWW